MQIITAKLRKQGDLPMKAVIMCGGAGSRLRPLTETKPKPLIRLMNVPILTSIVSRLTLAGIKDISLSLGYKA